MNSRLMKLYCIAVAVVTVGKSDNGFVACHSRHGNIEKCSEKRQNCQKQRRKFSDFTFSHSTHLFPFQPISPKVR